MAGTATIVAGVAGIILGILVGPLIKRRLDQRVHHLPPVERRIGLYGTWLGTIIQTTDIPGQVIEYPVTIKLSVSKHLITGTLHSVFEHIEVVLYLRGVFLTDSVSRLEFSDKKKRKPGFGSIVGELDTTGTIYVGNFAGYSSLYNKLIHGRVNLEKLESIR